MGNTKENTGLQLSDLKVSNLPELQGWKEKQEQLVKDNPYVEITDNKTYEVACKSRTALLKGRTELEKQDKLVASKLAAFRKDVKTETDILIAITLPFEEKQQVEVKRYEGIKEAERLERERVEKERVDGIKAKIDAIETDCMEIIQSMTFQNIIPDGASIASICKTDFDFEEYEILYHETLLRIENAAKAKIEDLNQRDDERIAKEKAEEENRLLKAKQELQAKRLTEIMPYVAFGDAVDLTSLSDIEESAYSEILSSKKALFEADAKEKKEEQELLDAKAEEEKEAIYEIRKKRLEDAGMLYSDEHDTLWLKEDAEYILLKEDVADYSALEFEEIFTEVKSIVMAYESKIEKEKIFDIRVNRLAEIGIVDGGNFFENESKNVKIVKEAIFDLDAIDFETIITDAKLAIEKAKEEQERADKQKAIDFKLAKEDAERLKKENKARVKRLSVDKKVISESLEVYFADLHLSTENAESLAFIITANTKIQALKNELLTELEKL